MQTHDKQVGTGKRTRKEEKVEKKGGCG